MTQTPSLSTQPPAYTAVSRKAAIEQKWAREALSPGLCSCQNACRRNDCVKFATVTFGFELTEAALDLLSQKGEPQPQWRAILLVWTRNPARLMSEGFTFSENNVLPGYEKILLHERKYNWGMMGPNTPFSETILGRKYAASWRKLWNEKKWPHIRTFELSERVDVVDDNLWSARLLVFGKEPRDVIKFQLSDLTRVTTTWGKAINMKGETVFDTRGGPDESFNSVFTGLLEWWTWPGDLEAFEDAVEGTQSSEKATV